MIAAQQQVFAIIQAQAAFLLVETVTSCALLRKDRLDIASKVDPLDSAIPRLDNVTRLGGQFGGG